MRPFFFSGFFWGIIFILLGISAILKTFNIYIPLFRVFFALFFIYIGISILTGGTIFKHHHNTSFFSDTEINISNNLEDEYNIIFGQGTIDLTEISLDKNRYIETNTIFGKGVIKIKSDTPIRIKVSSAFGSATLPNNNSITFGETQFKSKDLAEGENYVTIDANVVFGALEIIQVDY